MLENYMVSKDNCEYADKEAKNLFHPIFNPWADQPTKEKEVKAQCVICGHDIEEGEKVFRYYNSPKHVDECGCEWCSPSIKGKDIAIRLLPSQSKCPECGAKSRDITVVYDDDFNILGCNCCVEEYKLKGGGVFEKLNNNL